MSVPLTNQAHLATTKAKGRPRKQLDAALLEAAAAEFFEYGYTDANLERIAAASETTKPALYRRYPSKEALFKATLDHMAKDFELDLSFLDPSRPVADALYDLARLFHEKLGSSRVIAMTRLGAQESAKFPKLILHFRETVMKGFMGPITAYFQWLNDSRVTRMPDTLEGAIIFSTLTGRPLERLLGVVVPDEKVEPYLRELVRFFLAGYSPPTNEGTDGR